MIVQDWNIIMQCSSLAIRGLFPVKQKNQQRLITKISPNSNYTIVSCSRETVVAFYPKTCTAAIVPLVTWPAPLVTWLVPLSLWPLSVFTGVFLVTDTGVLGCDTVAISCGTLCSRSMWLIGGRPVHALKAGIKIIWVLKCTHNIMPRACLLWFNT